MQGSSQYRQAMLRSAGSFWTGSMADAERPKVASLLSVASYSALFPAVDSLAAFALNFPERETGPFGLRFSRRDVEDISGIVMDAVAGSFVDADGIQVEYAAGSYARPESYLLQLPSGALVLFNSAGGQDGIVPGTPAWSVRVKAGLRLDSARTSDGRLLQAGQDFYARPGVAVFRENPSTLFPAGTIPVASAREPSPNLLRSSHGAGNAIPGTCGFLNLYRRGVRTNFNLARAAAEYAGILVFQEDCNILESRVEGSSVRYLTDAGAFTAPYGHSPLPAGPVSRGTMAGCGMAVHSAEPSSGDYWWKRFLHNGMSLDRLCPVQGLRLPPGAITLQLYDSGDGLRTRVYGLEGTQEARDAFNACVAEAEGREGSLFGHLAGLSSAGQSATVPAVDFYMLNVLGLQVLVVEGLHRFPSLRHGERALEFILEERPSNKMVVTI
jgi:hypothetical protein